MLEAIEDLLSYAVAGRESFFGETLGLELRDELPQEAIDKLHLLAGAGGFLEEAHRVTPAQLLGRGRRRGRVLRLTEAFPTGRDRWEMPEREVSRRQHVQVPLCGALRDSCAGIAAIASDQIA